MENTEYESLKTELGDIISQKEIVTSIKKAIWYIEKIPNSETKISTSTTYLNKYCTTKDSILIEKSKLINFNLYNKIDEKTLDSFEGLKLSQYVIMVARSSPYLLAIFNQYHKNQLTHEVKRRILCSVPYCNGIMKTKLLIGQFYSSYMIHDTLTTLMKMPHPDERFYGLTSCNSEQE